MTQDAALTNTYIPISRTEEGDKNKRAPWEDFFFTFILYLSYLLELSYMASLTKKK